MCDSETLASELPPVIDQSHVKEVLSSLPSAPDVRDFIKEIYFLKHNNPKQWFDIPLPSLRNELLKQIPTLDISENPITYCEFMAHTASHLRNLSCQFRKSEDPLSEEEKEWLGIHVSTDKEDNLCLADFWKFYFSTTQVFHHYDQKGWSFPGTVPLSAGGGRILIPIFDRDILPVELFNTTWFLGISIAAVPLQLKSTRAHGLDMGPFTGLAI